MADTNEVALAKEEKRKAEMLFSGQDSDEARLAVKLQRDLKKKKDALRKAQKKLKTLKPEDEAYTASKEDERKLLEEIDAIAVKCPALAAAVAEAKEEQAKAPSKNSGKVVPPKKEHADPAATPPVPLPKGIEKSEAVDQPEDTEAHCQALASQVEDVMRRCLAGPTVVHRRVSVVHPQVAETTLMMEEMLIVGGNARTFATISALRSLIKSTAVLVGSSVKDVDTKAFEQLIDANFTFIRRKRAASAGMLYVKHTLVSRFVAVRDEVVRHRSKSSLPDSFGDPRDVALRIIDQIEAEVKMSLKSIVEDRSLPYTSNADTILVFGRSSVVEYMLLSRANTPQRKPKKVIVLDAAPLYEGRTLARKLSEVGISVTYGLLTACCTLMPKCTRVFIGASSVLQNGDIFARGGTALVAACAKSFRKPVLCLCESYKFVPEVWLGNLAQNTKLADIRPRQDPAGEAVHSSSSPLSFPTVPLLPTKSPSPVQLGPHSWDTWAKGNFAASPTTGYSSASGYLYDLTPASYVDMVICEMGCLHTSAIVAAIKDREGRDATPLLYLSKS